MNNTINDMFVKSIGGKAPKETFMVTVSDKEHKKEFGEYSEEIAIEFFNEMKNKYHVDVWNTETGEVIANN